MTAVDVGVAQTTPDAAVEALLRLADDRLVLGHRLSEWCGHAPILEEDIALGNVALDLLGQAQSLLKLAGAAEARGRDEDALAYFRDADAFRNVQLVELPRGDFAHTMVRQFLFDAHDVLVSERLSGSPIADLAGVMAKAHKEARYHVRHSGDWVVRLGDGTDESRDRAQRALDALWPYTAELFAMDAADIAAVERGYAVDVRTLREAWLAAVTDVIEDATLRLPASVTLGAVPRGGRTGHHTEHLAPMLEDMQVIARAHPGAIW